ncbi:putative rhamnogalacturonyl hydrolase [Proteiniphilum saccharofermentans]|uniref:Putative rhamnogalacturonyl hydrolase n=1 Tax=Proteiniphilum saccharofermentans TaxID=1642647 RepID=A0A1R3TCQ7_9BACT|nr:MULTISPECIES: glycoside hydrolase family 88 protein [Proteiniphilum]SCD21775.1 putative rhamnogalacturonyl hydrolase [Proteiniphilum saccharofermentans]
MKKNYRFICVLFVTVFLATNSVASQDYFDNFPVNADPKSVGDKLSKRFLESKHQLYFDKGIHYAEVCTWYGALRFAELTDDQALIKQLRNRFELLFHIEKDLLPPPIHVDQNMFGCLPLRLYGITGDKRYLDLGLPYADTQWILPANAREEERKWHEKGYSWQTRLWIDDMYMITIVQSEAYTITGNAEYMNRAAKEMVLYLDELQHANGLFYHAPDVPFYWGRGDGWMAVGMTELLFNLPESDPNRERILKGYLLMMNNLKKYINRDGLWNQLIDDPESWTETSGSAMFTYAMIAGVKNGWLDEGEFAPVARRAWLSLCNYINDDNDLTEVCIGTGKKNSKQYYLDRPRIAGDFHGQAPVLWCAYALLDK